MSERHKRLLRLGTSGLASMLIDVTVLVFLVEVVAMQVALAALLASSIGALCSFVVNKFWAFKDSSPIHAAQVLGFATVALGSALGVAAFVQLASVELGTPYLLSKAMAAALVFACWSYPIQSRFVFATRRPACGIGR